MYAFLQRDRAGGERPPGEGVSGHPPGQDCSEFESLGSLDAGAVSAGDAQECYRRSISLQYKTLGSACVPAMAS